MPHSSKKYRKTETAPRKSGGKATFVVIGVVVAILVAAGGWYAYSSAQNTIHSSTTTTGNAIVYATLATSQGTMKVELFGNATPITVNNFVSLAQSGFYNNLVWHRIVKGFVIQTGDPNTRNGGGNKATWGQGGSNHTIPLEIVPSLHNDYGYLGMARASDPNSGSSQFYINLANNTNLDGQYTVFGKVVSGMNVALALGNLSVDASSVPINVSQAMLISVTISNTP